MDSEFFHNLRRVDTFSLSHPTFESAEVKKKMNLLIFNMAL